MCHRKRRRQSLSRWLECMSSRVRAELPLWVWVAQQDMVISLHSGPLGHRDSPRDHLLPIHLTLSSLRGDKSGPTLNVGCFLFLGGIKRVSQRKTVSHSCFSVAAQSVQSLNTWECVGGPRGWDIHRCLLQAHRHRLNYPARSLLPISMATIATANPGSHHHCPFLSLC